MPRDPLVDFQIGLVCIGGIALALALLYYSPFQKARDEGKRQRRIARGLPPDPPKPRPLTKAEWAELEREDLEDYIRNNIGYYDDLP